MRVLKANEPPAHGRLGVLVSEIHPGCSDSPTGGWGEWGSPNPVDSTAYAVSDETNEVSDDASVVIGGS